MFGDSESIVLFEITPNLQWYSEITKIQLNCGYCFMIKNVSNSLKPS